LARADLSRFVIGLIHVAQSIFAKTDLCSRHWAS
jgi:hypothetical protein